MSITAPHYTLCDRKVVRSKSEQLRFRSALVKLILQPRKRLIKKLDNDAFHPRL